MLVGVPDDEDVDVSVVVVVRVLVGVCVLDGVDVIEIDDVGVIVAEEDSVMEGVGVPVDDCVTVLDGVGVAEQLPVLLMEMMWESVNYYRFY